MEWSDHLRHINPNSPPLIADLASSKQDINTAAAAQIHNRFSLAHSQQRNNGSYGAHNHTGLMLANAVGFPQLTPRFAFSGSEDRSSALYPKACAILSSASCWVDGLVSLAMPPYRAWTLL